MRAALWERPAERRALMGALRDPAPLKPARQPAGPGGVAPANTSLFDDARSRPSSPDMSREQGTRPGGELSAYAGKQRAAISARLTEANGELETIALERVAEYVKHINMLAAEAEQLARTFPSCKGSQKWFSSTRCSMGMAYHEVENAIADLPRTISGKDK